MTELPEHPASHRLALLALCGDLVVAIDAMSIREVRRAAETASHEVDGAMSMLELDGERIPGWDLGELVGIDATPVAWVIINLPGLHRPVGFRVGRCVMVHSLPVCRALPRGLFTSRSRAFVAGFSTAGLSELADHVSGVVLDLARMLGETELAALAKVREEGREAARQA